MWWWWDGWDSFILILTAVMMTKAVLKICFTQAEDGPESWGGGCNTGVQQSPVNIPRSGSESS